MKNFMNRTSLVDVPKTRGVSLSGPWPAFFFDWNKVDAEGREAIVTDVLVGSFGASADLEGDHIRLEGTGDLWRPIAVLGGAWLEEIGAEEDNLFAAVMSQLDGILMAQAESGVVQLIGEGGEHQIISPNIEALKVGPYRKEPE